MNLRSYRYFFLLLFLCLSFETKAEVVPDDDPEYLELHLDMGNAFDSGDSLRFFKAVNRLEDYLLAHGDLHKYYTQRCNEVVFMLNQEYVFEAYFLSLKLSRELSEQKLEREIFMAFNMLGHVYSYCGHIEMSRKCYQEALERAEKEGYHESVPGICMNLAHEEFPVNPQKAMEWLDKAASMTTVPQRQTSIAALRAVYAFRLGDINAFQKGYRDYKKSEAEGVTAVFGYELEIYNHLLRGDVDKALAMIDQRGGRADQAEMKAFVYEYIGKWKEVAEMRKEQMAAKDSLDAVILSNSMQGIQNELDLYEAKRETSHQRIITLVTVMLGLLAVILLLSLLTIARRHQVKELRIARDMALESDRMKSAFISNISHEIRTPLNIVNGFAQVLTDADYDLSSAERHRLATQMQENTQLIVSIVDELLDLSILDSTRQYELTDRVVCTELAQKLVKQYYNHTDKGVELVMKSEVADDVVLFTNLMLLTKVLNALLSNAIKYTDEGEIRLIVKKTSESIQFVVEDTGCGISDENAERVFVRFEKLDSFKIGLGLGLSLARAMTFRLHGDLILDTSYKNGARFVVTLPHVAML